MEHFTIQQHLEIVKNYYQNGPSVKHSVHYVQCLVSIIITLLYIIRKTLKGRKQTNKYRRRIERHLPKTDESIVRPAGERR